ncbi:MAG: hypothetical protein EYC70_08680 [Planctomycetota bacterium]|nr:MAG: hypothetical protein EYC70_08680 [Planctomycetota bacterium]
MALPLPLLLILLQKDTCPYCQNDPERMQAAGVVTHQPSVIGFGTPQEFVATVGGDGWIFLETPHIRWASSLGPESLSAEEAKTRREEIERLRAALPDIPKNPRKLDPWLRLHLLAQRGEDFYARFQKLLQVSDADFPEERSNDGPYMGNGRFLGEKDKFELILHARRATHLAFTKARTGAEVTDALRLHPPGFHKMLASVPAEDSDLRQDVWLWPHLAHLGSHLFFCAYKHYSFEPPPWLDEGLALFLEKEANPVSFTREGEEGVYKERGPADWSSAEKKLAASTKTTSFAALLHRNTHGDLSDDELVQCWSLVRFLAAEHPEKLAGFLGGVKGQLDTQGYPSGKDLDGLQSRLLKELWDWTPAALDAEWRAWVVAGAGAAESR